MAEYEKEAEEYIEAFYNDPAYSEEYGIGVVEADAEGGGEEVGGIGGLQEFDTFGEDFNFADGGGVLGEDINAQQPDFQMGYSERDRFTSGTGGLTTGSKEELYAFNLTKLLLNRGEYLKEYLPAVKKIPRWYLKNPETLVAAIEMFSNLETGDATKKVKSDAISTELKKQSNAYGIQRADIYRYYKLVTTYFI